MWNLHNGKNSKKQRQLHILLCRYMNFFLQNFSLAAAAAETTNVIFPRFSCAHIHSYLHRNSVKWHEFLENSLRTSVYVS